MLTDLISSNNLFSKFSNNTVMIFQAAGARIYHKLKGLRPLCLQVACFSWANSLQM